MDELTMEYDRAYNALKGIKKFLNDNAYEKASIEINQAYMNDDLYYLRRKTEQWSQQK